MRHRRAKNRVTRVVTAGWREGTAVQLTSYTAGSVSSGTLAAKSLPAPTSDELLLIRKVNEQQDPNK